MTLPDGAGTHVLRAWELAVSVDDVLRGQGADPGTVRARRPQLLVAAERALAEGLPLLAPSVAVRRVGVSALRHERLGLEGGGALTGPLIARHLGPAEELLVLVCTVGEPLEWLATALLPEDAPLGLALDGLGTMAVETLATEACRRCELEAASAGLHTSIALSPGMIGWPLLEGQRELFALLPPAPAGVTLTPSGDMLPRKSLSMILGLSAREFLSGRTCDYCRVRETCKYQDHYAAKGPDGVTE